MRVIPDELDLASEAEEQGGDGNVGQDHIESSAPSDRAQDAVDIADPIGQPHVEGRQSILRAFQRSPSPAQPS